MAGNYWDKVTNNRIARRRLLRSGATLSVGAAALALIGCGDEDDGQFPFDARWLHHGRLPSISLEPIRLTTYSVFDRLTNLS